MSNAKKINYISIGKKLLSVLPLGKKIMSLILNNWTTKRNFGKIKFQGQWLQDMIAYMYLSKNKDGVLIKDGFYIDIGAFDGINNSNNFIFEQLGWKGICIEPQQDIFKNFLTKFRTCDCYNVAISSKSNESVEFFKARDFSGINEGLKEGHKNWAKEYGEVEVIKVKTITFDDLMKNYHEVTTIDFISIDVEGHEMEILKTIDFQKYKFRLLTIENNEPKEIKKLLEQNGYKEFIKIGMDIMFIPKDEEPILVKLYNGGYGYNREEI